MSKEKRTIGPPERKERPWSMFKRKRGISPPLEKKPSTRTQQSEREKIGITDLKGTINYQQSPEGREGERPCLSYSEAKKIRHWENNITSYIMGEESQLLFNQEYLLVGEKLSLLAVRG